MTTETESFGRNLRERRKAKKMTLKEVSARTALSVSFLSDLERGVVSPSVATLSILAGFYGIQMHELMNTDDQPVEAKPRITKSKKPGHTDMDWMILTTFSHDYKASKHLRLAVEGDGVEIAMDTFGVGMAYQLDRDEIATLATWLEKQVTK